MKAVADPIQSVPCRRREARLNLSLAFAVAIAAAGAVLPWVPARLPPWGRALLAVLLFAGLTASLPLVIHSPFAPNFSQAPDRRVLEQALEAAWWLMAGRAVVGLLRLIVVIEHKPRETRLVSDLIAGLIYAGMFLAIINFAFAVPVRGLLATSGVIAIVLGLALQSTMSDVFAGIALGIERPYQVGDDVWVEGGIEGRVEQINWRSTHVETGDGDRAIVPNSIVAKSRLINRSHPTSIRQESVSVVLNPRAPPARCIELLAVATKSCTKLLPQPAPAVSLAAMAGDGARYVIGFAVPGPSLLVPARTELLDQVHRHLRFTGIGFAIPGTVPAELSAAGGVAEILHASENFTSLTAAQREDIAARMTRRDFSPGEMMICQGGNATSVFVVGAGTFSLTSTTDDGVRRIGTLSPGNFIGLVGIIVGEPYGVAATALTPCVTYELAADDLRATMSENPGLAEVLVSTAQHIHASLAADARIMTKMPLERPEQLVDRLKSFFGLSRIQGAA